jgi:uncharacterized paraquat-inducible protein A
VDLGQETIDISPDSRPDRDRHFSFRKHDSINRAWAFLIAAFIMYIPANPELMMRTTSFRNAKAK